MFGKPIVYFFKPYQFPVFYQSLAFHITKAIRATILDEDVTDSDRLEAVYLLNEIQSRVATRLHSYNMGWNSWSDHHMAQQLESWAVGSTRVRALMEDAVESAFAETHQAFDRSL
ncbi:MAG: hypothetical protein ACREV8_05115 [Gammaproteobacteria bacterium]